MNTSEDLLRLISKLHEESASIPQVWDGRESILEMKDQGYPHWKQMEWTGFYFQFLCEQKFREVLEVPGKRYGKTEFDAFGIICWDFKAHVTNRTRPQVITNDSESISLALDEYGHYGLVLANGEAHYNDEDRTFKQWHDALKGGMSLYEEARIERGASSRLRKTRFSLSEIQFLCLDEAALAEAGVSFQKGFRNSDGKPRSAKVNLNTRRIPDEAIIATQTFARNG